MTFPLLLLLIMSCAFVRGAEPIEGGDLRQLQALRQEIGRALDEQRTLKEDISEALREQRVLKEELMQVQRSLAKGTLCDKFAKFSYT